MNGHLSNKNVVFVSIAVGVLLVGGAFVFNIYKDNKISKSETLQINKNIKTTSTQAVALDSDGDGLKNWEEVLLGTDPKNPDTDGDGTNDKDEIDQNRNPLVKGPNDNIKNSPLSLNGNITSENNNKTTTQNLAIELFAGYVKLKENKNLSKDSSNKLITNVISRTIKKTDVKIYNIKDITVIKNPGKEMISEYNTKLKNILKSDPSAENDIVVLKRIIETKNTDELVILDSSIKRYERIVSEMLLLTVPEPVSIEHINAINALTKITENVKGMRSVFTNPLGAIIGVKEYDINESTFVQNLITIGKYFKSNKVQ